MKRGGEMLKRIIDAWCEDNLLDANSEQVDEFITWVTLYKPKSLATIQDQLALTFLDESDEDELNKLALKVYWLVKRDM